MKEMRDEKLTVGRARAREARACLGRTWAKGLCLVELLRTNIPISVPPYQSKTILFDTHHFVC